MSNELTVFHSRVISLDMLQRGFATVAFAHNLGDNGLANLPAHTRAYWSFQSGSRVHQCPTIPALQTSLI